MRVRQKGLSLLELLAAIVLIGTSIVVGLALISRSSASEREFEAVRAVQAAAQAARAARPIHYYDRLDGRALVTAAGFERFTFNAAQGAYEIPNVGLIDVLPVLSGRMPTGYTANTAYEVRLRGRAPEACTGIVRALQAQAQRIYIARQGTTVLLVNNTTQPPTHAGISGVASGCSQGDELWLTFG